VVSGVFALRFIFNKGEKLVEGLISSIFCYVYLSRFLCRSLCGRVSGVFALCFIFNRGKKV